MTTTTITHNNVQSKITIHPVLDSKLFVFQLKK